MPGPTFFSADRFALKLGLFYAAYFLFGGVQLPYFPLWLESRGLDAQTIGLIIAAPMLVRILVTPLIAHQADRRRALKAALAIASGGGALAMTGVTFLDGPVPLLAGVTVAACFFAPVLALSDAYAITGLKARGLAYGPVRLWGSVAFIVANIGAGALLTTIAPSNLIWLIVAALAATFVVALSLDPLTTDKERSETPAPPVRSLFGNRTLLAAIAAAALIQGSHALYYGFSTMDWRAAGYGGVTIGVLWAAGVAAEIVLFALSARLPAALTPAVLLAIGGLGAALRWTVTAFEPPLAILLPLQCLHAASFGAAHLGAIGYLARWAPPGLAATAQGLLGTVSGLVMASATGLSGWLYASVGGLAYLAMTAMALAGFCFALLLHRAIRTAG